jgi:hypothetical protein
LARPLANGFDCESYFIVGITNSGRFPRPPLGDRLQPRVETRTLTPMDMMIANERSCATPQSYKTPSELATEY